MNQREFQALGASELDPMAVVLYVRTFRRYMNFATGQVSLSLSRLQQELEYHPPACSRRGKIEATSTKRVRTLINHLVNVGLLVLVRPGNAAKKEAAIYQCVLATTDKERQKKPSLGQVRPNEEGHIADTVQGHIDGHSKPFMNKGLSTNQGHIGGHSQNFNEGHISERSEIYNSLSNARDENQRAQPPEIENSFAGEELRFNDQFLMMARTCGMEPQDFSNQDIANVFDVFRTYRDNANTLRTPSTWLNLWRTWATREKARYAKRRSVQQPQQRTGNSSAYRNSFEATADVFEQARRYSGVDVPGDASRDDDQDVSGYQSVPPRLRG